MLQILEKQLYDKDKNSWLNFWNHELISFCNNCYSYAIGDPWGALNLGETLNPGFSNNSNTRFKEKTVYELHKCFKNDGLTFIPTKGISDVPKVNYNYSYLVAAFVSFIEFTEHTNENSFKEFYKEKPINSRKVENYHIIRQHHDNIWSERNGADGKVDFISTDDNKYPTFDLISGKPAFFMGYFSIPNTGLNIGIPQQLVKFEKEISKNKNLTKYSETIKILQDFYYRAAQLSKTNTKESLQSIVNLYGDTFRKFMDSLEPENEDDETWSDDILNALEYANKTKLQKFIQSNIFKNLNL